MNISCIVDVASREVSFQDTYRIASYDHNVDVIHFSVEPIEDFSLDTSSIKIAAQGPNKARHDYAVDPSTVQIEEETGYITFDWPIPAGVTEMPIGSGFKYGDKGQLIFAVCAEIISGDTVSKAWHSDDGIITVVAHLEPEAGGGEDPEEEATNAQKIGQLQTDVAVINTQVGALANGSPTPVETIAEMTDESAVYLYTGSETGYTAGNWYYYDGSAWTSGGTYGGAVTDTTLSISGAPADAKAVGDALADFTIEVDDTLSEQGKAADAKAVGDALVEKADTADVEAEITALDDRVSVLESGGDDVPYEERGDLHTLFVSAEEVEMRKTDYRLNYNSSTGVVTEQSYTSGHPSIYYIDPAKLGYERLWIHWATAAWPVLADYDPDTGTYTFIANIASGSNKGILVNLTVDEGHYIATSSNPANWTTGKYVYLGRVWIKTEYQSLHDGFDVPIPEAIPCDLYPVDVGYPAFYIDMSKYQNMLVNMVNSFDMGTATYGIRAYSDTAGTSYIDISSMFGIGKLSPWIFDNPYLVVFYRGKITEKQFNMTMGYVSPENAKRCKQERKWGAQFAFHNCDTMEELILACSIGSLIDVDVCRTLDGKFVGIHGTSINGHVIAQTNLADLGLTYNQWEVTDAMKIMRQYGTVCYFNFRETTSEQRLELIERSYNYLGQGIVYDDGITEPGSVLANHLDKYFTWVDGQAIDTLIGLGAKKGRIYCNATKLQDSSYNAGDVIVVKAIASGETLSNFAWDGECAYLWINSNISGFING